MTNAAGAAFVASNYPLAALNKHDTIVKVARILRDESRRQRVETARIKPIAPESQMRNEFFEQVKENFLF
jgi:hypothetical protein